MPHEHVGKSRAARRSAGADVRHPLVAPSGRPTFDNVPCGNEVLHEGLVITIEPFLTTGCGRIRTDADGWTIRTTDGAPVALAADALAIAHTRCTSSALS